MKKYKIGFIGTGGIAIKMANTINGMENAECYAVGSRSLEKAQSFAHEHGFSKAYGSYEELADDCDVDLIYIATPHSLHFDNAKMCILKGKPVLCEKSFTVNAKQAEELLALAKEKGVFITEAIWTRYMPFSKQIKDLVDSGIIGKPYLLTANLGYDIKHVERIISPELAGGALLDVGVYPLNFAAMVFGKEIEKTASTCLKTNTGVDAHNNTTLYFSGERMAVLTSTMCAATDRQGIISGDKGHIIVENINNPQSAKVIDKNYNVIAEYHAPKQITGYEYQIQASIDALENGWLESPYMPHEETIRIMKQMDTLREEWGIKYPFE